MAALAYLLLLNATNITNATASDESFGVYDLLQEQCHTPPGLEFENAYGDLKSLLFIALATITLLTFRENAKVFASWAFERAAATAKKCIDWMVGEKKKENDEEEGEGARAPRGGRAMSRAGRRLALMFRAAPLHHHCS